MYAWETMDTRFWGPSAWQLLHLVAHSQQGDPEPYELFFNSVKQVLPCKFCRQSTTEFMETELPLHPRVKDTAHWLYDLHNRVNKKLRDQSKTDPQVRDPGPDPTFGVVRDHYTRLLRYSPDQVKVVPGADFLSALAVNYPEKPTSDLVEDHSVFWTYLRAVFPFSHLRVRMNRYMEAHPLYDALQSRAAYKKWVYALLKTMCKTSRSYRGMCQHVGYYKSACHSKSYRGKTCRRTKTGQYMKHRDHARTYRVTHNRLLT